MNNIIALTTAILCGNVCATPVSLTTTNTVVFERSIEPMSVIDSATKLAIVRQMVPETEQVYFVLNSTGGVYKDSLKLANFLKEIPNLTVICAKCASGAAMAFILQSKNRLVAPASSLMMHEMRTSWYNISRAWLQGPDFSKFLKKFVDASNEFDRMHYKRIGISRAKYRAKILDKDWVLVGSQIKKHNLADTLTTFSCDEIITKSVPIICSP